MILVRKLQNGTWQKINASFYIKGADFYVLPDNLESEFDKLNPFVTLTISDNAITAVSDDTTARNVAAQAAMEQVEQDEQPTAEDITLDMLADHEERICMIELNTTTE